MHDALPIFLFTDFGWSGPYVGQLQLALHKHAPGAAVFNLMHDAPPMQAELAAYLLPRLCEMLPRGVVIGVVDPGVGGKRDGLVVDTGHLLLVGPDNGLFARVDGIRTVMRIDWQPAQASVSFHGRDIFAPVAARLAQGKSVAATSISPTGITGADWPENCLRIIYIDGYGNAMTGVRANGLSENAVLRVAGRVVRYAETFCRASKGEAFWYRNSQGLVEIAVAGCSAAAVIGLVLGDKILID